MSLRLNGVIYIVYHFSYTEIRPAGILNNAKYYNCRNSIILICFDIMKDNACLGYHFLLVNVVHYSAFNAIAFEKEQTMTLSIKKVVIIKRKQTFSFRKICNISIHLYPNRTNFYLSDIEFGAVEPYIYFEK